MPFFVELSNLRMKKCMPTLLNIMISTACYSQYSFAEYLISQCMLGVPSYNRSLVSGDPNTLPVTINSDLVKGHYQDDIVFLGNVDMQHGNSRLYANQVQLHQQQNEQTTPVRTVDALGNVHYDNNQIILNGPKAWSNLTTKDTNMWNGSYQMVGRQGRGIAGQIKLRGNNRYTILENGTFTSCLLGSDSWSIIGSKMILDRQEEKVEIWNARFKVGNFPVLYSPYVKLPIGDHRYSGFLMPNMRYGSNNGFSFILPYYWNISPYADVTIMAHYMSKRSLQLQNEFRYLTQFGSGLMEFDYLPSDNQYSKDKVGRGITQDDNFKRLLFYWHHAGIYDQHWRFNADYINVSDPYYFNDLNSKYHNSTDGYATQKFSFGYEDINWNATLSTKSFQMFSTTSNRNFYRALPQLDLSFSQKDDGLLNGHFYAQAVKFTNVNSHMPEATRLHIEPTLNLLLSNVWASLNVEAKFLITHYKQDDVDYYNSTVNVASQSSLLKHSINRMMPQFKVDGRLVFDRNIDNWIRGYTQTLEPRIQYLYIPYRDQRGIYPYDSTLLQTDYNSLFRAYKYSGLDRIHSANKVTTGVTTRIYDTDLVERFNFSLGHIYLLTPFRIEINQTSQEYNTGSLVWAGNTYWKVSDRWGVSGGLQYDALLNNIAQGNITLEYRRNANRMVQLNYRYSSPEYVAQALNNSSIVNDLIYKKGISQVGATASWSIANAWSIMGSYYYDTRNNRPAEQIVVLQYGSCCYAIRLGYERKMSRLENNNSKYHNQILFNIELRGLSSHYGLGSNEILDQGIIPYQRAF